MVVPFFFCVALGALPFGFYRFAAYIHVSCEGGRDVGKKKKKEKRNIPKGFGITSEGVASCLLGAQVRLRRPFWSLTWMSLFDFDMMKKSCASNLSLTSFHLLIPSSMSINTIHMAMSVARCGPSIIRVTQKTKRNGKKNTVICKSGWKTDFHNRFRRAIFAPWS